LDRNVNLPANATAKVAQTSLLGSQHLELAAPEGEPGSGKLADGSEIPMDRTGRYPTTEEVLSSLGVVVNKGNLGALQDITDEAFNAVTGRAGTFADLVPRLAELTSSLDRQTNDIIAAAEGLDRFAGILARSKDSLGRTLDSLPAALEVLNNNRANIVDAFGALGELRHDRLAHPATNQGRFRRRLQGPVPGDQGAQRLRRRLHQGSGAIADFPVPLLLPAERGAGRLLERIRDLRPDTAAHRRVRVHHVPRLGSEHEAPQ